MNGSYRFALTVTDGNSHISLLFSQDTAAKLYRACRAFAFDDKVHYRINLFRFRNRLAGLRYAEPENDALRELYSFFCRSVNGRYFAVCSGDIAGSQLMLQVLRTLALHNREEPGAVTEEKIGLLANYDRTAVGLVVRKAGQAGTARRRCRYCGRSYPDTTFRSRAHTISEALGNKTLFTNDECDGCNTRFCRTIEIEFINRLSHLFPVYNIAGKNGSRQLRGRDYTLCRLETDKKAMPIVLSFSDATVGRKYGECPTDLTLYARSRAREWRPRNIYRFLCKFVIGSLDNRLLRYFGRTIEWINGRNFREILPLVCVEGLASPVRQPLLYIYRRRRNENLRPICSPVFIWSTAPIRS